MLKQLKVLWSDGLFVQISCAQTPIGHAASIKRFNPNCRGPSSCPRYWSGIKCEIQSVLSSSFNSHLAHKICNQGRAADGTHILRLSPRNKASAREPQCAVRPSSSAVSSPRAEWQLTSLFPFLIMYMRKGGGAMKAIGWKNIELWGVEPQTSWIQINRCANWARTRPSTYNATLINPNYPSYLHITFKWASIYFIANLLISCNC